MKHEWMTYGDREGHDKDPDIDHFAYSAGEYHNGPCCKRCGVGFCEHCNPDRWDEECTGKDEGKEAHNDNNLSQSFVAMDRAIRESMRD